MKTWFALLIAVCVSLPAVGFAAEDADGEARSVKSGKSNSDNRDSAPPEDDAAANKVKGSKSNTSERSTTTKGSKSNSDN